MAEKNKQSKAKDSNIDGKEVPKQYYTVKSGSTIITLSADYAKTLSAGEHELTVMFTDGGTATTAFKLIEDTKNPKTADSIMTYIISGVISIFGLIVATIFVNKKAVN